MQRNATYVPAACLALLSIATPPAQAQSRCEQPYLTGLDIVACAKAAEGIDSLRQYAWRTRMIHNLYMPLYVSAQPHAQTARVSDKPQINDRPPMTSASR